MITDTESQILIIEDDATLCRIAEKRCAADCYATHCVATGEEALAWAKQNPVDLILLDIQLPGMDGLTCIERLRALPHHGETPVLVISASEEPEMIEKAFALNVDDFIHKPVNWQILGQRIATLLRHRRLQKEANLLHRAVSHCGEAILISDRNNQICYINPAFTEITGYSRDDVIGRSPNMFASGQHNKDFYQSMWNDIISRGTWKGTITDRRKDGSLFAHRMHITAVHDHGDPALPITHYIAISSDITDEIAQERLEREREKMNAIVTMIGGIAHDFNNMFTGILGNTFLMRRGASPEQDKRISTVESMCNSGAQLIRRMLAFVQKDTVQMEEIDIAELLEKSVANHPAAVIARTDKTIRISADRHHLRQMIQIMLENADDAIQHHEQGKIRVTLERITANSNDHPQLESGGHYAALCITDNGCGMDEQTMRQVFDPFFTTKKAGRGSGMGLAMLYGSMRTHHGAATVESTPGEGSTFCIYFPLREEIKQRGNAPAKNGNATTQNLRLLLVDDDETVREVSEEILRSAGFRVESVSSGQEALRRVDQLGDAIDVALLDVIMPDTSGIELAHTLRRRGCQFPIIFCTGYNRHEVIDQTSSIGHVDVVAKPFSYEQLLATIRKRCKTQG